ncbi:hypothetical protein [uncultured Helicobacter sp.]|uniref:hypothetical protein n=1 Tax=uncultured Helicobacter sp. TaxID=175537 RepID=UPI0025F0ADCB|nr:hypothetical protein [uncultured Helicobacter sp.]
MEEKIANIRDVEYRLIDGNISISHFDDFWELFILIILFLIALQQKYCGAYNI